MNDADAASKFLSNVEVTRHVHTRIGEIRHECPTFDDRKFAEHLFLHSLELMGKVKPFAEDAPERFAFSIRAYLMLRPDICVPGADFSVLGADEGQ